jgi:hypothetical protein
VFVCIQLISSLRWSYFYLKLASLQPFVLVHPLHGKVFSILQYIYQRPLKQQNLSFFRCYNNCNYRNKNLVQSKKAHRIYSVYIYSETTIIRAISTWPDGFEGFLSVLLFLYNQICLLLKPSYIRKTGISYEQDRTSEQWKKDFSRSSENERNPCLASTLWVSFSSIFMTRSDSRPTHQCGSDA